MKSFRKNFLRSSLSLALHASVVLCLSSLPSYAGWEVSGGDIYALQFVKIGRMLAEELSKPSSQCPLQQKIDLTEFKKTIENSEVLTSNQDRQSQGREIYINRLTWMGLINEQKIELVLKAFTAQTPSPFKEQITRPVARACIAPENWEKIFYNQQLESGDQASVPESINLVANALLSRLSTTPDAQVLRRFEYCKLESAVIHTHARGLLNADFSKSSNITLCPSHTDSRDVSVEIAPIAVKLGDHQVKDGLNFKNQRSAQLLINRSLWRHLSRGRRMELLLHEYLSIIGSNDQHYQISSLLFHDLPANYYLN